MDRRQFEIVILPLYRRIYSMCLVILADRHEAADTVQDTFSILWERRNELDDIASPEAYAVVVARKLCMRRLKATARMQTLDDVTDHYFDNCFETRSEISHLRQLIAKLPAVQQRVMLLSSFGGCLNSEIAQITGESEANVRQLLSRARRKIREMYNPK